MPARHPDGQKTPNKSHPGGTRGLKKASKQFADGEVIFREGDASDRAFEIVSGNVEIAKIGDDGEMRLALLGPGQMFGEMGILDQGTRSATAKAVGPVTVTVVSRKDFLAGVRDRPDLALSIMSQLVERLRGADEMLAHRGKAAAGRPPATADKAAEADAGKGESSGLVSKLFGWKGMPRPERIRVLVAPLLGEKADAHTKKLLQALDKRKGLTVKALKKPLKVDAGLGADELADAVAAAARRELAKAESDLLIWGEVLAPGLTMHLRFVSHAAWNEDTPGGFALTTVFPVPVDIAPAYADFMHAVTLAATVPKSEAKGAALARDLPLALDAARAALDAMPGDLTRRERAEARLCFGHAMTRVAMQRGDIGLYQRAAAAYKEALSVITEKDLPVHWTSAQKNLGAALKMIAERTNAKETFGDAADALRAALRGLSKERQGQEWAATQNRLGEVLYRLDFDSGDTELLKHALGAYQAALQVYTRAETPMQWAEVMNNFAQVTQVLGGQLKNAEALEKAANACRAVLEIRTKAKTPLLWAATQNNLGSALFLLGRITRNVQHLQGAAEAFELAGGLYKSRGMAKMAAVTDKNLGYVNQLLAQSAPKEVPKMRWEGAGPDEAAESPGDGPQSGDA